MPHPDRLHAVSHPTVLLVLLLNLIGGSGLLASEAPTQQEWERIADALAAGQASAVADAEALIHTYPDWPGSYMALATYYLGRGNESEAIRLAQRAREQVPEHPFPAAVIIGALDSLGKHDEALTVLGSYQDQDADGTLHLLGARAALGAGRLSRAEALIARGMQLAGGDRAPAPFHVLQGLVHQQSGMLLQAEARLQRAVELDPDLGTAWFDLGLIQQARARLAEQQGDNGAARMLRSAAKTSLAKASGRMAGDPDVKLAAGLAALAVDEIADARVSLEAAFELAPKRADITIARAAALVRTASAQDDQDDYLAALELLDRLAAQELDPALQSALADTLSAAAMGARRFDLVLTALRNHGAEHLDRVNRGIARWAAALQAEETAPEQAARYYTAAVEDLRQATTEQADAAVYRYLGHALANQADFLTAQGQQERAQEQRAQASQAYGAAIQAGDLPARRFQLALDSQRGPEHAYASARAALGRYFIDADAWRVLLANYGAAEAWRHPIHLGVWGALLLVLLIAGLKPKRQQRPPEQRRRSPPPPPEPRRPTPPRSPAAQKARRLQQQNKIDETFLPKKLSKQDQALEKGRKGYKRTPSQAARERKADTLMPQTAVPPGRKDAALKGKKRS